jgi:hypothetical protein
MSKATLKFRRVPRFFSNASAVRISTPGTGFRPPWGAEMMMGRSPSCTVTRSDWAREAVARLRSRRPRSGRTWGMGA